MKRRVFVYLIGLLAGCGSRTPSEESTRTPSATATRTQTETPSPTTSTPTATPTATPVEEPTETPTQEPTQTATRTPTEAERRGLRQLERAERDLTEVVSTFTGEFGSELTDVKASSVGFEKSEYSLQIALAEAQDEYMDAIRVAANAEQRTEAERLHACWRFLRHATQTQLSLVRGYKHLTETRDAFESDNASKGRDEINRLEQDRRTADVRYSDVVESSTVDDVSALEVVSADEYQNKLSQFESDIGVYRALDDPLQTFADGVEWLRRAKANFYVDDRNVPQAQDYADNAIEDLRDARAEIQTIRENNPETTINPLLGSYRRLATQKIQESRAIDT
jgi:hypothetical protein